MSKTAVCPECKTRPAPAGRYLCVECEEALVAATDGETRRKSGRAGGGVFSGVKLRAPRRRQSSMADVAMALEEAGPFYRTDERPKWLQALVMFALVAVGLTIAWSAKQAAEGHSIISGGPTVIQDMGRGLLSSWAKLKDALH